MEPSPPETYNVSFHELGNGSADSLPLGNGDAAANVWVDKKGDIGIYLAKSDAWDEHGRLVKVGRISLSFRPNIFLDARRVRLCLTISRAEVGLYCRNGKHAAYVRLRVDAHHPVLVAEVFSKTPVHVTACLSPWREKERELERKEMHGVDPWTSKIVSRPDKPCTLGQHSIAWFRSNPGKTIASESLRREGLEGQRNGADALAYHSFGAVVSANSALKRSGTTRLVSSTRLKRAQLRIALGTFKAAHVPEAKRALRDLRHVAESIDPSATRKEHLRWWRCFWRRSYINATNAEWQARGVSAAYARQRYLSACAGRGSHPIKFNGSLFTCDWRVSGEDFDADYRRWGGAYWLQNTRLIYWPMLAAGDYDLMLPFFRMYQETLPVAKERVQKWFGHAGAWFPETMYFWRAFRMVDYGLVREGRPLAHVENTYMARYWSPMLEVAIMMADYVEHTADSGFLHRVFLPLAREVLQFYLAHFPRDAHGRLCIENSHTIEQFHHCDNPLPDIAGLKDLTARVRKLSRRSGDRTLAQAFEDILPQLPREPFENTHVLKVADRVYDKPRNTENPELYAVFPFRHFGVHRPHLEQGRATFHKRTYQATGGWRQDAVQAACLGFAETAAASVIQNAFTKCASSFPAFWGPNFDWIPDQDHGCVIQLALQTMLLQNVDQKILLFPAWPRQWDVDFKLHAPRQTTIEASLRQGKLERIEITPRSRRKDVFVCLPDCVNGYALEG